MPLIGARSIGPVIQRAPLAATTAVAQSESGQGVDGGAVRVHRGSEASQLAESFDARAFTHEGQIYLPQSHGPLSGTKARSLLAHEITHVTQQRRLGSGLPSEDSPHGQQLEAQAVAAESGTRLPLAVSGDKGKVEIQPDESSSSDGSGPGLISASSGSPAHSGSAGTQRAAAANATFSNPDDQFRDQLDHNEQYLFDRFERRLRRLLLDERERGGTLIDAL